MNLFDIVNRKLPSDYASEAYTIPYQKADYSARMLKERLFQSNESGNRNIDLIQKHVDWIQKDILKDKISKILDLCCGPGLYSNMLAKFGHRCKGIDFSPACIEYARITKIELMLDCEYIFGDIRNLDYGRDFDFAILLGGELNTKSKESASRILKNLNASLKEGAYLLLELFNFERIEQLGHLSPDWKSYTEGIFASKPYLVLNDYEWIEDKNQSIVRNFVVQTDNALVEQFTTAYQAYTVREYEELFIKSGFSIVNRYSALANENDKSMFNLFGLLLKKIA